LHLGCSVTLTARDPWPRCWVPCNFPRSPTHTRARFLPGAQQDLVRRFLRLADATGLSSFLPFHSTLCDTLLPQEPVTFPRTRLAAAPPLVPVLSAPFHSYFIQTPSSIRHTLSSIPSIFISINSLQDARFKQVAWRCRPHGLEAALPSDVDGTRPGYVLHRVGQLSAPGCVIYQGFRL
jgi:hypothetical protein